MLTGIVKATRAHYAALQHRPAPDRTPLYYAVDDGKAANGVIQVKAPTEARRKAEMTKLINRLQAMYPECKRFAASYVKDSL